jgi:hypothetical protein
VRLDPGGGRKTDTSFRASGSVILKVAYGYTAEPLGRDILIDMAGDAMDKFARAAVPGAFMVDILPICWSHVPCHK